MLAALDGPVYALLRGKPVIALLARLNEHLNRSMPHMKPYTLQNRSVPPCLSLVATAVKNRWEPGGWLPTLCCLCLCF